MNVLSLFDGISCGMVALKRAGIKVDNYYASEIEPNAIKVSQKNYPEIVHVGDVKYVNGNDYKDIDLLIGGSPCQSFSFAGRMNGMSTVTNEEILTLDRYLELKNNNFEFNGYSYLFWEYVRILKECHPKYFLLENVKMTKKWQTVITETLGVEPILIDSALVSAQHRERLYWTNIPNVKQPEDLHIAIKDIETHQGNGGVGIFKESVRKNAIREYKDVIKSDKKIFHFNCTAGWQDNEVGIKKTPTLRFSSSFCLILDSNKTIRPVDIVEAERLQTLPDNYTEGIPITRRFSTIGNGWTVDSVAHILKNLKDTE